MTRRLAAILAADIVGYSALMGADQEGTLAALRSLRAEVFGPAVAGHRGKVVKSMGDGWLVEFTSAVDAVTCAMQVQDRLAGHEVIKLRIGVHIGDVVHEDEDVFGDGVNVAARLEALAEPGAVAISDAAFGSLDGTLRPSFDDQGEQRLKNIDRPVRVWARGGGVAGDRAESAGTAIVGLGILPVQTSDDRADVRELAEALTNDLYGYLGHSPHLRTTVTEAPSSDAWTLRPVLRARGDRLRLEAVLAAPEDGQRWTRRHDGSLADSFDWQDETAIDLAGYVHGVVMDTTESELDAKPLEALSAPEALYLGHWKLRTMGRDAELSDRLIRHAQARAPDLAEAYITPVLMYHTQQSIGHRALPALWQDDISGWQARAEELVGNDRCHLLMLAIVRHLDSPDAGGVRHAIANALRSRPFDPTVISWAAFGLMYLGEPEDAADCARKAISFTDPVRLGAAVVNVLGFSSVMAGQDEEALAHAREALAIDRDFVPAQRVIAAASAHLGRIEEARDAMAKVARHFPGETIAGLKRRAGWVENPRTRRLFDGLKKAGMPEGNA